MIELSLRSMETIEDRVNQWMIIEEHWTEYNLNRRIQLDYAKQLCTEIRAEIRAAYKNCPHYSEV